MKSTFNRTGSRLLAGAATIALSSVALSTPAHAIVPNDNYTPDEIVDTDEEFAGVGQFFRNDGFVCTGTLINPRTVLFAAHCVNDLPETDYNTTIRSAFSFNVNALPGFIDWINNGFASNPDLAVFDVNRIYYDPRSVARPDGQGFLEGDIALASLSDPAADLPTWSLLFSPLPTPEEIDDTTGTGYHVNITGYGRTGSGTNGDDLGIDWRRKSAENMIGALTSFDDRNTFLFGAAFGDLPQVLYRLDFDDPNKTNPFDFNLYKDEPLEREGTTAGGDSGGPLILDAANNALSDEDLVIAVLSGGSRFFGAQEFSSYGTESFYQPLYLFWDYIVATNPYRYVTAKAGDGNWEDGSHWETTLDPVYRVIDENGDVVNGLPTSPGNGITGDAPQWGEVCFDPEGDNVGDGCQDLGSGEATPPARNADGTVSSGIGEADGEMLDALGGGNEANPTTAASANGRGALGRDGLINANEAHNGAPEFSEEVAHGNGGAEFAEESPQASDGGSPEFSDEALPDPTLDNGLPGATDFVPDNIDPVVSADAAANVDPRYFDVTLGNAGTTTLSSDVTIDRLTVQSTAGLDITADGSLTSLIDVSQFGGTITVDGGLTSVGDYTLFGGALQGGGTITAPFVTAFMGAISPGRIGTIDTLTIDGSLIMTTASTLMIDIGPNGTSDLVAVTGEAAFGAPADPDAEEDEEPTGPIVAVGAGILGQVNGLGQVYTIVTAEGGVSGEFVPDDISPILRQSFTYTDNAVLMEILAASYRSAISGASAVQSSYARLFDQNRGNAALSELYGLDFASAQTIQSTFDGLAPVGETAVQQLAVQSYQNLQTFNANRLRESTLASSGGTIATMGNPIHTADMSVSRGSQPINAGAMGLDQADEPTRVQDGAIREDLAIYLAGGFLSGSGSSMPGYAGQTTDVDGYFIAGGLEYFPSDLSMIGVSGYYSDLEADVVLGQEADSRILALSLYGSAKTEDGFVVDGQLSLTDIDIDTTRTVAFLGGSQTLTSESSNSGFAAAVGISYDFEGPLGTISPGIELRYVDHSFDPVTETGGTLALQINREDVESLQGRIGLDYQNAGGPIRIDANIDFVHEYEDGPAFFTAQFAGGTGPAVPFLLANQSKDWGEAGLSVKYVTGAAAFGVGFDPTIGRDNADAQTYRATATFKF